MNSEQNFFRWLLILSCDIVVADEGGNKMQREKYTVGTWCVHWFELNRHKWNPRTEGGYRNLIEHHILPGIGSVELAALTEQLVSQQAVTL